MTAFRPIELIVAEMVRDFNAGNSKHRTATLLASDIIKEVRDYDSFLQANARVTATRREDFE